MMHDLMKSLTGNPGKEKGRGEETRGESRTGEERIPDTFTTYLILSYS